MLQNTLQSLHWGKTCMCHQRDFCFTQATQQTVAECVLFWLLVAEYGSRPYKKILSIDRSVHLQKKCLNDIELATSEGHIWAWTYSLILLNSYSVFPDIWAWVYTWTWFVVFNKLPGFLPQWDLSASIWAHKRLKFSIFDCVFCVLGFLQWVQPDEFSLN